MKKSYLLASVASFVLVSPAAFAATATATFDVSPWLQYLVGIASISVPVFLGVIATWVKSHFKIAAGSDAANIIDLLVTAGKQFTLGALAKAPTTVAPVDVKNQAIADFLNELSDSTQAAMKLKGVTAASIAQRIDGEVTSVTNTATVVAPSAPSTTTPVSGNFTKV